MIAHDPLGLVENPFTLRHFRYLASLIGGSNGHGEAWQAPCRHLMCLSYYAGRGAPLVEGIDESKKNRWLRKIICGLKKFETLTKAQEIPMMLSPEAELRALVESVAESLDPKQGDHLSLRKVRGLLATAIRATLACVGTEENEACDTVRFALVDLDRSTSKSRSGV